jgi:hypothetical protein
VRPVLSLVLASACRDPEPPPPVSEAPSWVFTETTTGSGLQSFHHESFNLRVSVDAYDHGNGLAAGDFDGDGHEDLLILSQCGPSGYFLGEGDGTFTDHSARLSMLSSGVRVGVTYGDYDEDGDTDFYVTFVRRPNALLRQNDDGTFTDVAAEAGVALDGHWSGATLFDADTDGDLDLAIAGTLVFTFADRPLPEDERCAAGLEGMNMMDIMDYSVSEGPRLLINQGAGGGFAFTDETLERGLPAPSSDPEAVRGFGDVVPFDLDRDRDLDLVFPEMFAGRTALLQNDGSGHFTEITSQWLPQPSHGASGATVADLDGDGWPDLFESDMHSDMWVAWVLDFDEIEPELRYLDQYGPGGQGPGDNPTGPLFGNTLWLSAGAPLWEEHALDWGAETFNPWGGLPADFDNDGDVDVFVPSGMSNPFSYFPSVMLDNRGDHFAQVQTEVGIDPLPWGNIDPNYTVNGVPLNASLRGSATADFDEDGDLDLALVSWRDGVHLLRTDILPEHHWLQVHLLDSDPYGAELELTAGDKHLVRWMEGSRGYLSQSTQMVHFGLGETETIDSLTVRWPDGTETVVDQPVVDTVIEVAP